MESEMAASATAAVKKELRKRIASVLKATDDSEILRQSEAIATRVAALPEFQRCAAVSVYLHMPKEAATRTMLETAFAAQKKVYVPKITGRNADDLVMVHATSLDDIDAFPKDKWKIPDPPLVANDGVSKRDDAMSAVDLDLVLLPGVAFDRTGGRLGHGKGYYDSFLRRMGEQCVARDKPLPFTVGICLSSQLIDSVPLSPHDRMLDVVVTPEEVIRIN